MSKVKTPTRPSLLNSKLLGDSEPDYSPDFMHFYKSFSNQKLLKKLEIISYENIEETLQTYTAYNIHIVTDCLDYVIQKRYSEFRSLSLKIEKKYKDLVNYMMNFPKKILFGKLDKDVIEERQKQLNDFLKILGTKYHENFIYEFLDFLQIREHYEKAGASLPQSLIDDNLQNKATSNEEKFLIKILEKINSETQNLVALFTEIENFFVKAQPILSIEFIKILFFGENRIKGLTQFCGKRLLNDESHLICTAGLRLFAKLLDYEFNKDAEAFLQVFSKGSTSIVSMLQFGSHITDGNQKPCTLFSLRIFDFYMERNPILKKELILAILGENSNIAYEEYEKWKQQKKFISKKTENYIIEEQKSNEKKINQNNFNSEEKRKNTLEIGSDQITLKEFLCNKERRWDPVKEEFESDIKIKHFKGIYIKLVIYMKHSARQIFDILQDKTTIFSSILEEYKVLEKFDEFTSITYEKVRWNTSKSIKHLIFISEKKTEMINDDEFYIYKRTINNYKLNGLEIKKEDYLAECIFCIRITTYQKEKKDYKSKITIICKNFNQNSMLFISTDLLGETKILSQNLKDMKKYCDNIIIKQTNI